MLKATEGLLLPTSIIGSLPRPSWYTENLGTRSFLDAMVDIGFREQYVDALSVYLREQELAGLDVVTDGDCRFDHDVGGQSWTRYPPQHMSGFEHAHPQLARAGAGGLGFPRGHILHDYLEARVMPRIVGPVGRGELQYAEMWKAAQRLTTRPVKFGTVTPELVAFAVQDSYYEDLPSRIMAISNALNEELHELADAGCPVIQMEEPQIHLLAARGIVDDVINPAFMVDVFNNTVRGLRGKTEVWCHTCWGNPSQQRMFATVQSYEPALEFLNQVDADVITFETKSSGTGDLAAIGRTITDKRIGIGVIDHHTLQVESPEEVADVVRLALEHIPVEHLLICSDCGMGREGMSRRHAGYKIVSLVLGTNIVRKELGIPEAECLAADPRYSLIPTS
jgi:5-methyltetrahydropteroyltriglutamate--homocysteine methyltransferase